MGRTLTISEDLYRWLEEEAAQRGVADVEHALEQIRHEERIRRRREAARRIDEHRQQLYTKYGKLPDSVPLIRQDRGR